MYAPTMTLVWVFSCSRLAFSSSLDRPPDAPAENFLVPPELHRFDSASTCFNSYKGFLHRSFEAGGTEMVACHGLLKLMLSNRNVDSRLICDGIRRDRAKFMR